MAHVLRRRTGPASNWGLWRVQHGPDALGYLVTKDSRKGCPHPIGFVLGTSVPSLAAALRIYHSASERKAKRDGWRKWVGFTLVPVDSRGRRIYRKSMAFNIGEYRRDGYFAMGAA